MSKFNSDQLFCSRDEFEKLIRRVTTIHRLLERIAVTGVGVCSEQVRFDDLEKVVKMIEKIPILSALNREKKLVFVYINET